MCETYGHECSLRYCPKLWGDGFHAPALKSHLMQAASWEENVILIRQLSLSEAVLQDA